MRAHARRCAPYRAHARRIAPVRAHAGTVFENGRIFAPSKGV